MVQQGADMSAGIDTYFLKRRKGRSGSVPAYTLPQKWEIDRKNTRLQIDIEGDHLDIDSPDSSFTDHDLSNSKYPEQVGASGHNASRLSSTFDGGNSHDAGGCKGLASFAMFSLLPRIMAYLPRDDLVRLALVNKDFYHEAMRVLYKHLAWDVQDERCNTMMMRLISAHTSPSAWGLIKPATIYVRSLFLQVRSPPASYDHETGFRLGLLLSVLPKLRFLRKLSVADCRDIREIRKYGIITRMSSFVEEIIWGEGTTHLHTFEILMERDLTFFTSLLSEETSLSPQVTLKAPSHSLPKRKSSIKHFTLRGAYPKEGDSLAIAVFEYQLAYLLLVLSPSLTHLTLVGLPKPQYLACPQDVGTGEWGGSVGKVFDILGPRALRSLEELTIEAADTRYEVAEGALSSWITERSIYVKPPTDEELRQKRLKNEERELRESQPTGNGTPPCPISNELRWRLFGRFHYEDYEGSGEPHINCDSACPIHGSTSGTFTLPNARKETALHVNPLLRRQQPKRNFRHLHLLNCPEPWPAFYTIACLHPPTTMHFSSPWMDSSSSDIPDSLRELAIEKYRLAVTPKLRKAYGESPAIPDFNQGSFTTGVDHSDRDQASLRPTGTHRLHCRRIRKKMEQYMNMLEQAHTESWPMFSPSLAQVVAANMKRIELRTLERVSMKLLQNIVKWYGESLEIIGISRLDGSHKEASATGHVRGWGKILGRCSNLKELRIVWNLFDDLDWEEVKSSGTKMKFGIGERSVCGKEALIRFSEEEWWESGGSTTQESKEITEIDDSSLGVDNGEGPSTQRPTLETTTETPPATIFADKSSESKEGATRANDTQAAQGKTSAPVKWLETWCGWSAIKKFFPPETSCFSYITAEGGRYLKKAEGPANSLSPTEWTMDQMKELLLFLVDWKYRKLEEMQVRVSNSSMNTATPRPPAKRSLSPQKTYGTCHSGYQERPIIKPPSTEIKFALLSRYRSGAWGDSFRVAYEGTASSNKVYHVLFTEMAYPFLSMDRHNARVFQERLREEYLARESLLASSIWDIIDTNIGEGKRVEPQRWRDRFLVISTSDQAQAGGLKLPKGIIFTNPDYNEFEGDKHTEASEGQKRLGPWENALNELLTQTPRVFNIPAKDRLRALHHQFITSQLSSFFQEINLWHRKVRLESTLGHGLRRFCGLAWVMFEEVPTLENVVGMLENGREVTARPVRSYQRSKNTLEMVKIRCWSCGGGWAGDYKNGAKGFGNTPVRIRVGARECKCDFSNVQRCQVL